MTKTVTKPIQKRALATREKLLKAATALIEKESFEALRVDDVVRAAGVAKGTFFAHFKDKDALMEQIIGARMAELIAETAAAATPKDIPEMVELLLPLIHFMTSERYVFDVIVRHSGAAAISDIGPIATQFDEQIAIFARWAQKAPYRPDIAPELVGEGISAFFIQAIALNFCALNSRQALESRLTSYLDAWLCPK